MTNNYFLFFPIILFLSSFKLHATTNETDTTKILLLDSNSIEPLALAGAISYLKEDRPYSIEEITSIAFDTLFKPYSLEEPLESGQTYWGKVKVKAVSAHPDSAQLDWFFIPFNHGFTEAVVYTRAENGIISSPRKLGRLVPVREQSEPIYSDVIRQSKISFRIWPGTTKEIFIKISNNFVGSVPLFYCYIEAFNYEEVNFTASSLFYDGLFLGAILIMAIYSLLLFLLGKDKAYLLYTLYLVAIFAYTFYSYGIFRNWLVRLINPENPIYYHHLRTLGYLVIVAYLAFTSTFLGLKKLLPSWYRIFKGLILLGLSLFLIDNIILKWSGFNLTYSTYLVFSYFFITCLFLIFFLVPLYRTQLKKGYFISLGLLCLIVANAFLFYDLLGYKSNYNGINVLAIGAIAEMIIFSLGLSYRQKENVQAAQAAKQKAVVNQQLQELDKLKTHFYTNITHEFRTPLTVIQGIAGQIKDSSYKQEVGLIQRNTQQLLQLVNQLLDLSKLETNKIDIELVQGNVVNYIRYLIESFHSLAEERQVHLLFSPYEATIRMDYAPKKLQQIVSNLLSNALKFTPSGGSVTIKTSTIEKENTPFFLLQVLDTGIGIEAANLPHIFERFYQVKNRSATVETGTGVGLALSKELIQLLGGTIEVQSTPNELTTFTILLPIKREATILQDTIPVPPATAKAKYTPSALLEQATLAASVLADATQPSVLLVEDNKDVLYYLINCLKEKYQLLTAMDGATGLETAMKKIPDLIISDVMMPNMDGYELCERLKTEKTTSHIPIILLTAKATTRDKIIGLSKGADAYLVKPFHENELEVRLEQLFQQRKNLQTYYSQQTLLPYVDTTPIKNEFLQTVTAIIEKDLSQEINVVQLSKQMNIDRSQLYRKIKALTGLSTTIFIRHIRLKHAFHLLTTTEQPVSDIAYEVGFKDPAFFSRSFSKVFGKSPSKIRKSLPKK